MFNKSSKALLAMALSLGSLSADLIHPNGCKGPSLCTNEPIIDGCGWFAEMGIILEQMRISHTDVAYLRVSGGGTTYADPSTTNTPQFLNFGLDAGVKCALGYHTNFDDWTAKSNFEWLASTGRLNKTIEKTSIIPTYVPYQFYTSSNINELTYTQVAAHLNVDYFLFDLQLSRGSYISRNFSYEPYFGLQCCWMFNYGTRQFFQNASSSSSAYSWKDISISNFYGLGPMVGTYGQYYVTEGWSIYSQGEFAILFGEHYMKDTYGFVTVDKPSDFRNDATQNAVSPMLRGIFGARFDKDILNDHHHFSFKAGFDSRCYFNQYPIIASQAAKALSPSASRFIQYPWIVDNGTFAMIGLILELGYDF